MRLFALAVGILVLLILPREQRAPRSTASEPVADRPIAQVVPEPEPSTPTPPSADTPQELPLPSPTDKPSPIPYEARALITGHVRFDDGVPIVGAAVTCWGGGGPPDHLTASSTTRADGSFRMFVGKRALYTVRARVGYAWEALKEHVATEDELDFVVSRRRRLTVRLTEAGTGNEIPIRHVFMRWPQAAVSTRASFDIVEGEAALVLPLLSQVDPDGMAHLTIVSDTSRATTMRIPRAQLQSGPLLRELTLPPRLEGSWTLKLQLREHDGTPFEGSGWLRFVPGDLRRRGGEFQKGRLRLPGLPRHFDELYLVVDGFGFKMNVEPPPAGAEITRSLTLTPPWELVVKLEFEHRPATVYAFYRGVGQSGGGSGVLNRDHGEFTFTGRGDGRWQFYLLDPHGRGSKGLWHKTLTLRGGDRMTLEPKIGVSKD